MRDALQGWANSYPKNPIHRDPAFEGSPIASEITQTVPAAIKTALGERAENFKIKGSAGNSTWALVPWAAIMHPSETTSVQEGLYVVYLLSAGSDRLYLCVGQGCTLLKDKAGTKEAGRELRRRGNVMRRRASEKLHRLTTDEIDLNSNKWRPELYEASSIFSAVYKTSDLPSEADLLADLDEALQLYTFLLKEGRWTAEDEIVRDSVEETNSGELAQAKSYAYHRRIERNASHSKKVKQIQGTVCRGCDIDLATVYGEVAEGLIDAHHLRPLSALEDGEIVSFDPRTDFAVLCPNCHRVIHRMKDVSDLEGLRRVIRDAAM